MSTTTLSRRGLLVSGGALTTSAAVGLTGAGSAFGATGDEVSIEDLGPGVVSFSGMHAVTVGSVIYVGSRNVDPSAVVEYDLVSGETRQFLLSNGNFVSGLAIDDDVLWAGVTNAEEPTNLYRCDLTTGEVSGAAEIPSFDFHDIAVAPDGILYAAGLPVPQVGPPPVYEIDPTGSEVTYRSLGTPAAGATMGTAIVATDDAVLWVHQSPDRRSGPRHLPD